MVDGSVALASGETPMWPSWGSCRGVSLGGVDLFWFFSDGPEPWNAGLEVWPPCFQRPQGLSGYLCLSQLRKCTLNFHIAAHPEVYAGFTIHSQQFGVQSWFCIWLSEQYCCISQTGLELPM